MMNLDSHVTLSVIFSFFSMLGVFAAIYVVIHNRKNEDTSREVATAKQFVEVNFKLDELNRNQSMVVKNTEKSTEIIAEIQKDLIDIRHTLNAHEKELESHENRLDKLENMR